ncbi:ring-hydroxylating dioxygenase, large terminal subunit [Caulobacter sp. AP07]|uniref:aromatic ring-hydroxylating oxygenase subunit alpha n=1 Tax=Caulobacter sp. AP07 TaxID=1144304 RepID=UPI000271E8D9|nr:aromatic ring-hydroxylating dioxygenase subunit alpha [Caulobacter sp. AP07]EJL30788.1 ring-hydroxylating dioxygenase, large terminal subunit [Caulobacter sp. AP07]
MSAASRPETFTNLSRDAYVSEAVYEEELRKVLGRQWLLAGHSSSLKASGDYYVRQVGPESLILTRDGEGRVRAYFNVCRHRGSRLLEDGDCGRAQGFVCPYHRWTYDLAGRLRTVPGAKDGSPFSYADYPLHEARCDTFHGWIYVWLGEDEPPALADVLGPASDEAALKTVGSERLKLAHQETYVIAANWKTMLENNAECYHCGHGGHPSLAIACDFQGFFSDTPSDQAFPLRDGMATFSMTGRRVCQKPLGTAPPDGFSTGFLLMPMFCGPVYFADHAVSLELTPLSATQSQLICEWYVHEDAVEGVDYEVPALIEVFHVTNLEDGVFAERNARGVSSRRFTPGPHLAHREAGVGGALGLYKTMMAAD